MKKLLIVAVVVVVVGVAGAVAMVAGRSNAASGPSPSSVSSNPEPSSHEDPPVPMADALNAPKGLPAMEKAAKADKYLFAFFAKEENEATKEMRGVFQAAMEKVADRADSVEINVNDASERTVVEKYGVDRAPMPLVLAVAPNGAITGGFPTSFKEQQLLDAFASPCSEKCLKQLQDGKLVFLCVQNAKSEFKDEALQAIRDFKSDPRYADATEVVMLDPTDRAEAKFLADFQVSPSVAAAVTVFLAPPGMAIGIFEGPVGKDQLIETLQKASSACGPSGCGPSGCSPPK